jgi:transposase
VHIERVKELLEVVRVDAPVTQRDYRRKGTGIIPTTKRTERRQQHSKTTKRAECGLQFGNNLANVGPLRIQGSTKIIKKIIETGTKLHAEALIQWDKIRNVFYFIWIDDVPVKPDPDPIFARKRVVALDPGSRPFQQYYSPTSGDCGENLKGFGDVLLRRRKRMDRLRARIQRRTKNPQHYGRKQTTWRNRNLKRQRTTKVLKAKLAREQQRLSGYVEAAHYNTAHFLLKNHDIIIAPALQTGWLTQHKGRKNAKLSRALYMWAHRRFRQRLAYAAIQYEGRYVYECAEPGTSKTCTACGAWNGSLLLRDKVYACAQCGLRIDRQLAGARNNFFAAFGMAVEMGWSGE